MLKSVFSAMIVMLIAFTGNAQDVEEETEPKGFDKNKLFVGGNFALNFGNITIVNISPQIGYRFNRFLAAGVGINGQYSSFRTRYSNGGTFSRENYGVAGLNIFGRVYPIEQVLLQLQPEANYTWGKYKEYGNPPYEQKLEGKIVPSLLAGAGAALPAGRGAFIVLAQYDLLQNDRTPYGDKVFFTFGYNFGF
jgi:hypothetical protein